ncbi:MAG: hypothetical protein WBV82_15735 [Myxococcaceae bacterium]
MTRWLAAVAVTFAVGAGVMSALTGLLGSLAEVTALAVVGAGLVGSSFLLLPGRPGPKPAAHLPGRVPERSAL